MSPKALAARIAMEKSIVGQVVQSLLACDYALSVDNGETETDRMTDAASIMDAMFTTDQEHLYVWRAGKRISWIFFVYGNSGYDVISDYTVDLEAVLSKAHKLADDLEAKAA